MNKCLLYLLVSDQTPVRVSRSTGRLLLMMFTSEIHSSYSTQWSYPATLTLKGKRLELSAMKQWRILEASYTAVRSPNMVCVRQRCCWLIIWKTAIRHVPGSWNSCPLMGFSYRVFLYWRESVILSFEEGSFIVKESVRCLSGMKYAEYAIYCPLILARWLLQCEHWNWIYTYVINCQLPVDACVLGHFNGFKLNSRYE